jgi:hypothetical protein
MKKIGEKQGYTIYWTDPSNDGGSGSGEVMVGNDSVGNARTQSEALRMAEQHIAKYLGKMGK